MEERMREVEEEEEEVDAGAALVRRVRRGGAGDRREPGSVVRFEEGQGDKSNIKFTAPDEFLLHKDEKNGKADSSSKDCSHSSLDIHLHSEGPKIEIQTIHPDAPEPLHPVEQFETSVMVKEFLQNITEIGKTDHTAFSSASSFSNSGNLHSQSKKTEGQTGHGISFESWHATGTSEPTVPVRGHGQDTTPKDNEKPLKLDLKRVLEEQDTYDLYCPNCHSCITERVILRKRKRLGQDDSKKKKAIVQPVQIDLDAASDAQDTEIDAFRCLSCFSFFIPTGESKIFNLFSKKSENESLQNTQLVQGKKGWISFLNWETDENKLDSWIFHKKSSENRETANASDTSQTRTPVQQPEGPVLQSSTVKKQDIEEDYKKDDLPMTSPRISIEQKWTLESDSLEGHGALQTIQHEEEITRLAKSGDANQILLQCQGDEPSENSQTKKGEHQEDTKLEDFSERNSSAIKKSDDCTIAGEPEKNVNLFNPFLFLKKTSRRKQNSKPKESIIANQGGVLVGIPDTDSNVVEIPLPLNEGEGITSISKDEAIPPRPSPQLDFQVNVGEQRTPDPRRRKEQDVLKAIVYGGLLEAISSLSVVSSAAGAGASTLNIFCLGLANLLAGLLLLIHNLLELHKEHETSDQEDRTTNYWKTLGRGYFGLHATFALLSFIVVGILPPVVYAFTFQTSDNKEYKLIAIAAVSLSCIAILAVAKARVQSPPKPYIKNLFYYLSLGVLSSGLSCGAGVLINKLLEGNSFLKSSVAFPSPPSGEFLQPSPSTPAWTSY